MPSDRTSKPRDRTLVLIVEHIGPRTVIVAKRWYRMRKSALQFLRRFRTDLARYEGSTPVFTDAILSENVLP